MRSTPDQEDGRDGPLWRYFFGVVAVTLSALADILIALWIWEGTKTPDQTVGGVTTATLGGAAFVATLGAGVSGLMVVSATPRDNRFWFDYSVIAVALGMTFAMLVTGTIVDLHGISPAERVFVAAVGGILLVPAVVWIVRRRV